MTTARITLGPNAAQSSVEVSGHDLSHAVKGLRITYAVYDRAILELDLATHETVLDGEVTVQLPASTHQALTALGWTPPAADPEGMREMASRLLTLANEAEAAR